jgi:hypothetical protein
MKRAAFVPFLALVVASCGEIARLGDPPSDAPADAGVVTPDTGVPDTEVPDTEVPDTEVVTAEAEAGPTSDGTSCKDIHARRPAAPSGVYTLNDGRIFTTYCEMSLDGGGWTAIYTGTNGNSDVVGHFEDSLDTCPDPAHKCLVHAPPSLAQSTEFLATCGVSAVAFMFDTNAAAADDFFERGVRGGWLKTSQNPGPRSIDGASNPAFANFLWTGYGENRGWILSEDDDPNQLVTPHTFASAYDFTSEWKDYCAGTKTLGAPVIHLYYR